MIKKMCDYTQLFAAVNRELVDDDNNKKSRNKKTKRFTISKNFIEFTETLEKIKTCLESIYVRSISDNKSVGSIDVVEK